MAIYHFTAKFVSRSNGHSAVAASAYRSGEKIKDERTGKTHDYTGRQHVKHTEIIAPDNAPTWATNRAELWNKVEAFETRINSQVAKEVEVALPRELTLEQNRALVQEFVRENFVDKGMIADIAIHESEARDGERNPHAHILLTTRELEGGTFSSHKNRDWQTRGELKNLRENWGDKQNDALARYGHNQRVDHRTLKAQGVEREPQVHLGKEAVALERKNIESDRGNTERKITHENSLIAHLNAYQEIDIDALNGSKIGIEMMFDTIPKDVQERIQSLQDRAIQERHAPPVIANDNAEREKHTNALFASIGNKATEVAYNQAMFYNRIENFARGFMEKTTELTQSVHEKFNQKKEDNYERERSR